jgi:hypothetical protein
MNQRVDQMPCRPNLQERNQPADRAGQEEDQEEQRGRVPKNPRRERQAAGDLAGLVPKVPILTGKSHVSVSVLQTGCRFLRARLRSGKDRPPRPKPRRPAEAFPG